VLEGITRHFQFTHRNAITRRAVGLAAMVFFAIAVVAAWQWRSAVAERKVAETQTTIAVQQTQEARKQADIAVRQTSVANAPTKEAKRQQGIAQEQEEEAKRRRKEAETATRLERAARLRALARQLLAQAALVHTEQRIDPELAAILAAESLRRFHSLESDRAIREFTTLLSRQISSVTHQDSLRAVAFSPPD
jgi:glycine/D-amino acid oxidase-like deaminating enzyme